MMSVYRNLRKHLSPARAWAVKQFKTARAVAVPDKHFTRFVKIADEVGKPNTFFTDYRKHADGQSGQITDPYMLRFLQASEPVDVRSGAFKTPDVFTCVIPHARVHLQTGLVATPDNRLIVEAGLSEHRIKESAIYLSPIPGTLPIRKGTVASIWLGQAPNYYHWVAECLPRLYSLSLLDREITLLLPKKMGKNWREGLEKPLPPNVRVEYTNDGWIEAENYVLASPTAFGAQALIPQTHALYLRSRLYVAYNLPEQPQPTRNLYITRKDARKRFVLNEDELIEFLKPYNFEVYSLDKLSYREQVSLFHGVKTMIAPHGAGNVNMIYADYSPRVSLLEFVNSYPKTYFYFTSRALSQRYYYIVAGEKHVNSDLNVNLAEFEQTFKRMLQEDPDRSTP